MSDVVSLKMSPSYVSTPEHVRSFVGRFLYIYTDKGELRLTGTTLRFVGKSGSTHELSLDSITDVGVGQYSRWAKPIRLDYIAIRHRNGCTEQTMLFTPTRSWGTPVWKTNEIVAEWLDALRAARKKSAGLAHAPEAVEGPGAESELHTPPA